MVEFDSALLGYIEGGGLMIRGTKAAMRLWRGELRGLRRNAGLQRKARAFQPHPGSEVQASAIFETYLDALAARATPNASVEIGVSAARAGHVANIAMRGSGVWMG